MMDFKAIEDYWFGEVEEPEPPFEPIEFEPAEFVNPFGELPSGSKETPEPEEEA